MIRIEEELKRIKVLDRDDIIKFKNYIYKKYPDNSKIKNAKILSDTIHQIIDAKLEGIPEDLKPSIKSNTLKNTIGNSKNLITLCDIFDSCVLDEELRNNFTRELVDWINVHSKTKIEADEIQLYLESKYDEEEKENRLIEEDTHIESQNSVLDSMAVIEYEEAACTSVIEDESEKKTSNYVMAVNNSYDKELKIVLKNLLTSFNDFSVHKSIALVAISILCVFFSKGLSANVNKAEYEKENYIFQSNKAKEVATVYSNDHMPVYMRYKKVDEEKLKSFLDKRNSILVKEPYFSTIISVSKEFNVNPILLFAITGQEQNFVPKSNMNASKIANNPYNVFHSWQEYNTDIEDSSRIAARTVINLSKNTPENTDAFLWIGKKYAEDKSWGRSVRSIFEELSNFVN